MSTTPPQDTEQNNTTTQTNTSQNQPINIDSCIYILQQICDGTHPLNGTQITAVDDKLRTRLLEIIARLKEQKKHQIPDPEFTYLISNDQTISTAILQYSKKD